MGVGIPGLAVEIAPAREARPFALSSCKIASLAMSKAGNRLSVGHCKSLPSSSISSAFRVSMLLGVDEALQ